MQQRQECAEGKRYCGQGGDIIQHLRTDTGARIKVEPQAVGCLERVILILAPDRPGDRWCDAQQALFRVHERITAYDLDAAHDRDQSVQVRGSVLTRCS